MEHALEVTTALAHVAGHVQRAVALARFEVHDPDDGPFRHEPLSENVPQTPRTPLIPALGPGPEAQALEALQYQLVWAADCAEYSDALNDSRQFLRAAGHVDLAARALLGLEGLQRWPAVLVRDLAAAAGLELAALVPALGMLPPTESGVFASFAWDVHHENPVDDPDDLGRRALTSYSVRGISWSVPKPAPNPVGSFTTAEELIALAPVHAVELAAALGAPDAFARTVDVHMSSWQLTTPGGPLRWGERTVIASLEGAPTGARLDLHLPAATARALGDGDVVRSLRVV